MTKPKSRDAFDTADRHSPRSAIHLPPPPDPRSTMPVPVLWHTGEPDELVPLPSAPGSGELLPPAESALWKKLKRTVFFWKPQTDPVQASVFGPPTVTPGQTVKLVVFLHHPDAADCVRTLARAFQFDAEALGSGNLVREVAREAELAVHLAATNAGVGKSLMMMTWRGQPHRMSFEVHVPWESPAGSAPGLISVGRENVRIGKVQFRLHVLPRKA